MIQFSRNQLQFQSMIQENNENILLHQSLKNYKICRKLNIGVIYIKK